MNKIFEESIEIPIWANLTETEIEAITDLKTRNEYKTNINAYYPIINKFSTLVPKDFAFSVPDDKLTCYIMMKEYMNYFYLKGMSRKEIIEMLASSSNNLDIGKKK